MKKDFQFSNLKRKKLVESLVVQMTIQPSTHQVVFDQLLSSYGGVPSSELAIVLSTLKAVGTVHQTNHWSCAGDAFYGDHLLFERLYNNVVSEIDRVAERAVGRGSAELVNVVKQTEHQVILQNLIGCKEMTLPASTSLVNLSMSAELVCLMMVDFARKYMQNFDSLSSGTDNLLAEIEDTHESHVFLLKQRLNQR